jgi:hypothetical protein
MTAYDQINEDQAGLGEKRLELRKQRIVFLHTYKRVARTTLLIAKENPA